ncbi:hypothetical protein PspR76_28310 [Pseudomonas sp. R76]|nr:hypothetical protein PspR76_28310 [Pseudomonas sp. R76]
MIVPTLRVVTPLVTLCVTLWDAERPGLHSHAERGNDHPSDAARICLRHRLCRQTLTIAAALFCARHRCRAIPTPNLPSG